jgi:predicted nucleotide-binding protein
VADLSGLHIALEKKLQVTARSVNRKIRDMEDLTLQSREVAALMVAVDAGLSIKKFATPEELDRVRAAREGQSSSTPSDSPTARPAPTPVAAAAVTSRARANGATPATKKRGKTVFVVHGRNAPLRAALFAFLRSLGLNPLEWTSALKATKSGSPTIMEVIEVMLTKAQGIVVLLTPDDLVRLKPEFHKRNEKRDETEERGQARPNVLFEAGIAMGSDPKNTVLLQVGDVKGFTDIGGIHVTQMNNSAEARQELAQKLSATNLIVDTSGTDWLREGDFEQETYE